MERERIETELLGERHTAEVDAGERFQFGANWKNFLRTLDETNIRESTNNLEAMLGRKDLSGLTFLDIGSGSGLSSLAAKKLGARVFSFDYDADSVECTRALKRRFFDGDDAWTIQQGSALDSDFLRSIGTFDIVYSWGVLHHTGQMWRALDGAAQLVGPNGTLFVAIYNDLGSRSVRWRSIKRTYCKLPEPLKIPYAVIVSSPGELKLLAAALLRGRPHEYLRLWTNYKSNRGMSRWHDMIDWVGGYPYEYAGPSALFEFFKERGFSLVRMKCDNVGLGCNEMVFERASHGSGTS